ncbi:MAG: polyketide synthase dehydratase domain-containing protein [Candidatus Riflebacteria bacterium]|nr:polyketide synthase dehydratase domain-containing protein [Candidatus Riflebacteria bacterium]
MSVAIVGKSSLFSASLQRKTFWLNLLGIKGLISGLATGQWPFSDFISEKDLNKLKEFVMNSGIISSGGLPKDGFEIPSEILKMSDVIPILALFQAKQALEDTKSFSTRKFSPEKAGVIFGTLHDTALIKEYCIDHQHSIWTNALRKINCSEEQIKSVCEPVMQMLSDQGNDLSEESIVKKIEKKFANQFGFTICLARENAPIPGVTGLVWLAIRELRANKADLMIVGGIDCVNSVFSYLDGLTNSTSTQDKRYREGLGMIALRRLEDAQRDGDNIYAVMSATDASFITISEKPSVQCINPQPSTPVVESTKTESFPRESGSVASVVVQEQTFTFTDCLINGENGTREIPWTMNLSDNPWILDHKPNYVIPALPLMCTLDWMVRFLEKETGNKVIGVNKMEALRWVGFDQPSIHGSILYRQTESGSWRVDLKTDRNGEMIRAVAAELQIGAAFPINENKELSTLFSAEDQPLPYQTHEVSHGPCFHLMEQWKLGRNGASCDIRNTSQGVPLYSINPGMLDASLHGIPWTRLNRWFRDLPDGQTGFPISLENVRFFDRIPTEGMTHVETRLLFSKGVPRVQLWLFHNGACFATFRVAIFSLPLGRFGPLSPLKRRAFFRDNRYVTGASISETGSDQTHTDKNTLRNIDWLPNTLSRLYRVSGTSSDCYRQIIRAEHIAQFARLHPADIVCDSTGNSCRNLPFNPISVSVEESGEQLIARGTPASSLDWKKIRSSWVQTIGPRRFFHDLLGALLGTFVNRVVLQKPEEFNSVASRPVMYLANHQIGLESPLFMALSYAMTANTVQAIAKPDHVNAWLGFLLAFAKDSIGDNHPFQLLYFDRFKPQGLLESLKKEGSQKASLLVHVEGTRATEAGQPVTKLSSVFLDMAIAKNIPVIPVRFVGGLPPDKTSERLDFPFGNGKQDYFIGGPILPETLKKMPYGHRPKYVMDQINSMGPLNDEDVLLPPDKKFEDKTKFFMETFGFPKMQAMLFALLGIIDDPCEETALLIKAVQSGKLSGDSSQVPPVLKNFLIHVKTKFS